MNNKIEKLPNLILSLKSKKDFRNITILISTLVSAGIFFLIGILGDDIYKVFLTEYYLVFHTIVEIASIVMYAASFLVVYYVSEWDQKLRMKVLVAALLFVAFIDLWHTFQYNGMPGLLVPSSIQTATSFWIIGRIGFAIGILLSSYIPEHIRIQKIKKRWMIGLPLILAVFFLLYISYFPQSFPTLFIEGQGLTTTKLALEYIIIFILFISLIRYSIEYRKTHKKAHALFIVAIIISIFSELAFTNYFNVYDTYNMLGHMYKLVASYMIFRMLFILNISYPYNKLDKAEKEISKYANNLEELVAARTEEINQINKDLLVDLEYAKTIQKAIMSVKHERYGNVEVFSEYIPYEKIGGDYYGFSNIDEEHLIFYIGDVAGHGIPAAMMTIFMKQTITAEKLYQNGRIELYSPKEVLTNLYNKYNATEFPLEMYSVMIYGIFNKKTKQLSFSSAGLNTYPLIYRNEREIEVIEHTGFPICKFAKGYQPDYENYEISLEKGNKILFYTDGLIEVSNRKGEVFGEERLLQIYQEKGHLSPEEISKEILLELNEFTKGVKLSDDVHYFIMEVQ